MLVVLGLVLVVVMVLGLVIDLLAVDHDSVSGGLCDHNGGCDGCGKVI